MLRYPFIYVVLYALAGVMIADAAPRMRVKAATPAPGAAPAAYYHTPEGVTFTGLDQNGEFQGDHAFAPANKWLQTEAEVSPSGAVVKWSYPTAISETGVVTMATSTLTEFQFRMRTACTVPAPVLTAASGTSEGRYTMAADGVKYGEYGTWETFAVNYQPGQTTEVGQANEILATNDPDARTILNMVMAGGLFSDITVYGFSESFYDCGPFYLEAVNALLYSEQPLTAADLDIKVFRREKTSVYYNQEIASLSVDRVTPLSDNRYYVEFHSAGEAPRITSAMQIVVMPAEGSGAKFSPMMPLQKSYRESNMGTCSLYATFKFTGKQASLQCLDFFGTEVTNDDDTSAGFLNHWAIGVKGSYDKPAGIENVIVEAGAKSDNTVYTITGMKAGTTDNIDSLPAGIYIAGGRKILKH